MTLEDLVEEHLDGKSPNVPPELQDEFARAVAAHAALQYALGETITVREVDPADRPPPELPDDYEVVRELGHGGMGVVYLVRQKSLDRLIAVKVLRPGEAAFGRLVQRFLGEARHLARLRHPNIVSIHAIGHACDEPYFTMDYIEGEPLSAILAGERLSPARALAILKQAAEGVRYAHSQGIIHRDLKPANILIDSQGRAYVSDFGLARDMTATSKMTHSGEVMGTPAYMAPEQAEGRSELIGETTDVHALGAILYEMLTGKPPYGCDAPAHVLIRLLKEEPVRPRLLDRRIPRDLETICLKALAKEPEQRYPLVQAFLEDLRRFESGQPLLARRPSIVAQAGRILRRHVKAAAVLLGVAILLALAPRFFDKTVEQLLAVADEQQAAGEYQAAVRVYRRALAKATAEERHTILQKMLKCCDAIQDSKSALDACLLVMESDPDISFGKYDYLVAQAMVTKARVNDPNLSLSPANEKNGALLKLAERRLAIFLADSTGTTEERKEAQETHTLLHKLLANEPLARGATWQEPPELPEGTVEELLQQAKNSKLNRWDRGKASYAAGLALEKQSQTAKALAAYRDAFNLMRPLYPTYDGIQWGKNAPPMPETELLRKVYSSWQRLDPKAPNLLQGGIKLRLEGVEIPSDLELTLWVTLYDPSIPGLDREAQLQTNLSRSVPIQHDGTARIGVADGHYHMTVTKRSWSWKVESSHWIGNLLRVDPPTVVDVEIRGNFTEVVLPATLNQEIKPLAPADGATVDLRRDVLRWTPVEGAHSYQVKFGYKEDTLTGNTYYGLPGVTVSSTSVCLGDLPPKEVPEGLRKRLTSGRTGFWSVDATDATDRRVGTMLQDNHPFFVAKGLGD